jgi:hypothetical protein
LRGRKRPANGDVPARVVDDVVRRAGGVDDVDGLESADSRLLFVQDVDRASVEGIGSVHGGDANLGQHI